MNDDIQSVSAVIQTRLQTSSQAFCRQSGIQRRLYISINVQLTHAGDKPHHSAHLGRDVAVSDVFDVVLILPLTLLPDDENEPALQASVHSKLCRRPIRSA